MGERDLFGAAPAQGLGADDALIAVAPCAPVQGPYDYIVGVTADDGPPPTGSYVVVPLGGRETLGVVWGAGAGDAPAKKLKRVARVLDLPPMRAETRRFLARAAEYTITPLGEMARLATRAPNLDGEPPTRRVVRRGDRAVDANTAMRARALDAFDAMARGDAAFAISPAELARKVGVGQGVVAGLIASGALAEGVAPRDAPYARLDPDRPRSPLSAAQAEAADALAGAVAAGSFSTTLLHGVTGSGKTEAYLEAVAACLRAGRQALVLLPEIALTDGFLERIAARFGGRPAEWHSAASGVERRRCWRAAADGSAQVVVGARSALFLPFKDLGLIVVDEEHDGGYKQEEGAIYNARDMAVLRASCEGAVVVLASATPSLETWANAESGRYAKHVLPARFGPAIEPDVSLIDIRRDPPERDRWMTPTLTRAVAETLARGEQALLFLNRRGYAPLTLCRACGARFGCPHCETWLVSHRFTGKLQCHVCGHSETAPSTCRSCGSDRLAACGPGVERLAEEAAELFPETPPAILSSDLAPSASALREKISAIAEGTEPLIIGTQIVAKGHNFPNLTLVGVIDADLGLHGGDFRAAERTFQLLRQVAGRAGRAEKPGRAMLQTAAPEQAVMRKLVEGDERGFLEAEAAARRAAGAPPYGRYAAVIFSGPDEATVFQIAQAFSAARAPLLEIGAELFGPAPAPIARVRGRARVRMLVKAARGAPIQAALRAWDAAVRARKGVRVAYDIDPQSFL